MSGIHTHLLKYALNKVTKRIVGVDDATNGLACGCLCPECKQQLVAKNGGAKREHHFAHYNGLDCSGARMTALHLLAQQIIADKKAVMPPDYTGSHYQKTTSCIAFNEIHLEEYCDGLRPDCIGVVYDKDGTEHQLWIEILVTHEVNKQKQEAIKAANISCIEIDLSDMLKTDYTVDIVAQNLLETKYNRKWINCPKYDEINQKNKIKHDTEESERIKRFEEEKLRKEEALRQREMAKLADKKSKYERVQKWYKDGNAETAKYFIAELKNKPFFKDAKECFGTQNTLYDALVPNNDFLFYVDNSPKNENGLELFYTLLHYYYNQTTRVDHKQIKQRLNKYQYRKEPLSAEEKIHLEQLISLRIIYILEKRQERHIDFNGIIKKYILDSRIRNGVLMVSSVLYHHIVGSSAGTFRELTKEIIYYHPHLAKSYLSIIQSQNKYPNNYYIGNTNMLDELVDFIKHKQQYPNEAIDGILKECYSFAFIQEKTERYDNIQSQKEDSIEKAWQELNEMYKKA